MVFLYTMLLCVGFAVLTNGNNKNIPVDDSLDEIPVNANSAASLCEDPSCTCLSFNAYIECVKVELDPFDYRVYDGCLHVAANCEGVLKIDCDSNPMECREPAPMPRAFCDAVSFLGFCFGISTWLLFFASLLCASSGLCYCIRLCYRFERQTCDDQRNVSTRCLEFGAPEPAAAPTEAPGQTAPPSSEALLIRLLDLDHSETYPEDFEPIVGVMKSPLLSVEDAATNTGVEDMDVFGFAAAEAGVRLARGCPHGLDKDEAGALHLYSADSPLYRELNARLRLRDRERLKCFFPLLKLMMQARNKLPARTRTVFRGVDQNLKGEFREGQEFYWWSFTSTTKRVAVTEEFLGSQGQTLFTIEASSGRDISAYSAIGGEDEVLLFPGAKMKVVSVMDRANVHMVQLQEVPIKFDLLK